MVSGFELKLTAGTPSCVGAIGLCSLGKWVCLQVSGQFLNCLSSSVLGVISQSPVLLTSLQSLYLVFLSSKQSFKGKLFILMRSDLIAFSSMVCDFCVPLKKALPDSSRAVDLFP